MSSTSARKTAEIYGSIANKITRASHRPIASHAAAEVPLDADQSAFEGGVPVTYLNSETADADANIVGENDSPNVKHEESRITGSETSKEDLKSSADNSLTRNEPLGLSSDLERIRKASKQAGRGFVGKKKSARAKLLPPVFDMKLALDSDLSQVKSLVAQIKAERAEKWRTGEPKPRALGTDKTSLLALQDALEPKNAEERATVTELAYFLDAAKIDGITSAESTGYFARISLADAKALVRGTAPTAKKPRIILPINTADFPKATAILKDEKHPRYALTVDAIRKLLWHLEQPTTAATPSVETPLVNGGAL